MLYYQSNSDRVPQLGEEKMRVLLLMILLFIYANPLQAKEMPETYNFFYNVEVQYETDFQRKEIIKAINDMLTLDTVSLKTKKYSNFNQEAEFWTIEVLIYRYFVPDAQNKTLGDNFYSDIKKTSSIYTYNYLL
jgi:hypothetical protein